MDPTVFVHSNKSKKGKTAWLDFGESGLLNFSALFAVRCPARHGATATDGFSLDHLITSFTLFVQRMKIADARVRLDASLCQTVQ